jgi:hypothetical protein
MGTIEIRERKVMHFFKIIMLGQRSFVAADKDYNQDYNLAPSKAYDHVIYVRLGLPLIPLLSPTRLYFSPLRARSLTFPIPNNQADALIRLFNPSITNPVFAAIPFVQHDGTTSLHEWGVTARFVRLPCRMSLT